MTRIEQLRKIVAEKQYGKVGKQEVDLFTASMLVAVHDALSPANQEKFETMPFMRLVEIGWKVSTPKEVRS